MLSITVSVGCDYLVFGIILLEKVLGSLSFLNHPKLSIFLVHLSHMGPGMHLVLALQLLCSYAASVSGKPYMTLYL